jgi:hypothetical protein
VSAGSAVFLAHADLAERLSDAPEPFWQHVREAILAQREAENETLRPAPRPNSTKALSRSCQKVGRAPVEGSSDWRL